MDLRGLLREARVPPGEGGEPHSREEVGRAEEEELRGVRRKRPRGVQHCQSERDLSEDNSGSTDPGIQQQKDKIRRVRESEADYSILKRLPIIVHSPFQLQLEKHRN